MKSLRIFSYITMFFLGLLLEGTVYAQGLPLGNAKIIEAKTQIEEMIARKYREQIGTQIEAGLFSVSANVSIKEIKEDQKPLLDLKVDSNVKKEDVTKNEKAAELPAKDSAEQKNSKESQSKTAEVLPEDLNLGNIHPSVESANFNKELLEIANRLNLIQSSQQNQMNQINAINQMHQMNQVNQVNQLNQLNQMVAFSAAMMNKQPESILSHYQITSVHVNVGLDSSFKGAYKREFENWLKKTVESDFGSRATSTVTNLKKIIKPEEPPKILTPLEKVSNFQILIGFSILASMLLIGLLLFKIVPSKDVRDQNKIALQIQEMRNANVVKEKAESKYTASVPAKVESVQNKESPPVEDLKAIAELCSLTQDKIAHIYGSNDFLVKKILEVWYQQGWNGRLKVAGLVDAVVSRKKLFEKYLISTDYWKNDLNLKKAFQEFPQLEMQDRLAVLESIYWDLLSANVLGGQSLESHFSSLGDLSKDKMQKVLSRQTEKDRALTLLHLPQDRVREYMQELERDARKTLLQEGLKYSTVDQKEIKLVDDKIKIFLSQEQKPVDSVDVEELYPNLMIGLSVRDEVEWLPDIVKGKPNSGVEFKRKYPTVAFIPEWPDQYLMKLFAGIDTKVAVTYLNLVPSMFERVQKIYPPKLAAIIRDEISKKRDVSEVETEINLEKLRDKVFSLIDDGSVNLDKIFKSLDSADKNGMNERKSA